MNLNRNKRISIVLIKTLRISKPIVLVQSNHCFVIILCTMFGTSVGQKKFISFFHSIRHTVVAKV